MIEIMVQDYCHKCPEFEARSSKQVLWANDEPEIVCMAVRCQHEEKCKQIMKNAERVLRRRWEENLQKFGLGEAEEEKGIAREVMAEAEAEGLPWYAGMFNPKLWPKGRKGEGEKP